MTVAEATAGAALVFQAAAAQARSSSAWLASGEGPHPTVAKRACWGWGPLKALP